MSISKGLEIRSENKCELCHQDGELDSLLVIPKQEEIDDNQIARCAICQQHMENASIDQLDHWRCLNKSMWSTTPAVQVVIYRILRDNQVQPWIQDMLNMMYLDEATLEWAESDEQSNQNTEQHKDSNGNILQAGDNVVLIKDLNVKGANFVAKRGTSVRRISLVHDNVEHIEGKVNDQHIVILTKYVKKS